ncbi:MAG: NADH-quinone oxidoreductase subunit C [Deltaproteobacteria bacterium]|nr:NADH-quinone oxidoreductase subunit C [Deltaproteobacteria bacterium]
MSDPDITAALQEVFPGETLAFQPGKDFLPVKKEQLVKVARFLKESPQASFDMLMDIVGIDCLALGREPRFELVYLLYSLKFKNYLKIKVPVSEDDLEVDSICGVWKGANWFEREVYDLFGIRFRGHPNLRRILCHDEFVGHALRKDYDIKKGQWLSRPHDPR